MYGTRGREIFTTTKYAIYIKISKGRVQCLFHFIGPTEYNVSYFLLNGMKLYCGRAEAYFSLSSSSTKSENWIVIRANSTCLF